MLFPDEAAKRGRKRDEGTWRGEEGDDLSRSPWLLERSRGGRKRRPANGEGRIDNTAVTRGKKIARKVVEVEAFLFFIVYRRLEIDARELE